MERDELARAMRSRAVVEAAFEERATTERWLEGVVEALRPVVDEGAGIAGAVVAMGPTGFVVDARVTRGGHPDARALEALLPRDVHAASSLALSGRPLSSLLELRNLVRRDACDAFPNGSLADARIFVGHAAVNTAVVIVAPSERRGSVAGHSRDLSRLALYIETGFRLHLRRVHPGRVAGLGERYVRPRSRVDSARHPVGIADVGDPTGLWEGVTNGTYSVAETRTTDGACSFLALENPLAAQHYRALSSREAEIARLVGCGHSSKSIAYSLCASQAGVSRALGDVAAKIGLPSRTSFASFAGAVLGANTGHPHEPFTLAEHAVLDLVRRGSSNAEIACRRGTSERTIANQVAALLRKTNTPSRRALAAVVGIDTLGGP